MAFTSNQLISGAYYLSGIVSREFETVNGGQYSDALQWLNEILADKVVDQAMVPYETTYDFDLTMGQEIYYIPNLISIDTIVFYLNGVRFSLNYTPRNAYFGSSRVENINTLPFQWYWERKTGGGNLYMYFKPDQNFPVQIHGIFRLSEISLLQNLEDNTSYANLGDPIFYSSGQLLKGQLVVNDVDLFGFYPNIGTLINYINTGIIPGVKAEIDTNGDFILYSELNVPVNITVETLGLPPVGATFISNVTCATAGILPAYTYNNGNSGLGATITANNNGALIVDTYIVQPGDTVLVKDAGSNTQNGIYTVTQTGTVLLPYILTRLGNYNKSYQIGQGTFFTALNGFTNAGESFIQTGVVGVIGTDPIIFDSFSSLSFTNFSTIYLPNIEIYTAQAIDKFYLTYLRYALAERICNEYAVPVGPNISSQLKIYESLIRKKSRILDLRMQKMSTLSNTRIINWGFVNLGRGWGTN